MDKLRPVRIGAFLVWGQRGGWRVPQPFDRWLVATWNWVACRLIGHDDTLYHLNLDGRHCSNCCKPLTHCTGYALNKRHERKDETWYTASNEVTL